MPDFGTPGYAPPIPGLTKTDGVAPGDPMGTVAMLMGENPGGADSTTEKMSKVIQLMREVSKEDPRIAVLVNDALRLLTEGQGQAGPGGSPVMNAGPPMGSTPMGGPKLPPF